MSDIRTPPIGTLIDRIQLLRRDTTAEDEGGQLVAFTPIATVWGRATPLSGRQTQIAEGRGVSLSHSVVLRFRNDLHPGDRMVWQGRTLDVVTAEDINGHRAYIGCACNETQVTG